MEREITFLRDYTHAGTDYEEGQTVRLSADDADALVRLGIAEETEEERDRVATFTEEQFEEVMGELRGQTDPSEDEVRAAMDRIAAGGESGEERGGVPDLNAGAGESGGPDVEGGEPRVTDWQRRSVRYLSALAMGQEDKTEGLRMEGELRQEVMEMSDEQWRDEEREAAEIVRESGLPKRQQARILATVEAGSFAPSQERLHTTSTTDSPKAGFLLPKPFLAELFVIVEEYGLARQLFRPIPMTTKAIDLKNVASKVVAYWTGEGENITASDMGFGEGELSVGKLAGLTSWTTELEEDMAISLLPVVREMFAEKISRKEDEAGFLGDGSASYGGFTGVLNLPGAQSVTFASGDTTAEALSETHLRSAKTALSRGRRQNARWVMHDTVYEEIKQLETSSGDRIFQEMIVGTGDDTLLGFPVETSEVYPDFDSVGADEPFISFGDHRTMLMGQRRGVSASQSREAVIQDPDGNIVYNAYQADGALLRITERIGFAAPSAVQPNLVTINTAAS